MKVSICVPIYGAEKYIEKCARSLFEQTYEDIEYIFVDDCSPDCSMDILWRVAKEYPYRLSSVVIVKHSKNEGLAIARNTAISKATGDFVFNVDSDDYIEKDAIESLVHSENNTGADIVTGLFIINESSIDTRYIEPKYKDKDSMLLNMLSNVWHHELCNRLIRRSLFVDNQIKALPYVNLCEDWQVVPRLVYYADKCITLEKYTYHYRQNYSSLTHSNCLWVQEKAGYYQEYQSLKVLLDFFKDTKYSAAITSLFLRRQADNIDLAIRHHDKVFFSQCRNRLLSVPLASDVISNFKMICIKLGYLPTSLFLLMHDLKSVLRINSI